MRIRQMMRSPVQTVRPDDTLTFARAHLRSRGIRHLVVTEGKKVIGVLSERDLPSPSEEDRLEVRHVMSKPVVTIHPDATIREAANKLRGRNVGCLPVVEEGKLLGILTTSNLLDLIGKGAIHAMPNEERRILKSRGGKKPRQPPI